MRMPEPMAVKLLPLTVLALALSACTGRPAEPETAANSASAASAAVDADHEPDESADKDPLLSEVATPHQVVAEAFVSAATPKDNLDSPASWLNADGKLEVAVTAKKSGELAIFDGDTGERLRTVGGKGSAPGQMDRPNGIAIMDDLAWVVERDNHRVQMFQLPDFTPLLSFGDADLQQPYGLWVHAQDGGYEVMVSDNYMSAQDKDVPPPLAELDKRFRRYQLKHEGKDWKASLVGSFGDTSEAGAIRITESIWGDVDNDRLLLAEEDVATGTRLREYGLDGKYRGRDVGQGLYQAQAEGIALKRCTDGSGWWVASDQFKDRTLFHVFDRRSLAHVGSFAGKVTANTDGVWLDEKGDARFPQGVFYAVHDDQALAAFDWRDIAKALQLPACPH